ncbi:MAG: hypothetical protein EP344_19040, partial [Bacteroidetes bacterium]
ASVPVLTELSNWYARQGMVEEEERILVRILKTDTLSRILVHKGQKLMHQMKFREAESCFLQAMELDSLGAGSYYLLINLYQMTRQHEKIPPVAMKGMGLEKAVRIWFLENMLNAYLITDRVEEAFNAVSMIPDNADAYCTLGEYLLRFQKNEEAKVAFAQALAIGKGKSNKYGVNNMYHSIAAACRETGNWEQGLAYEEKAIEQDSGNAWVWYAGAALACLAKQQEKAVAYQQKFDELRTFKNYWTAHNYMLLGEIEKAEQEMKDCLKDATPQFYGYYNGYLSLVCYKTGRMEEAKEYLQQASKWMYVYRWRPIMLPSSYCMATGQYELGVKFLLFVQEYAPNNPVIDMELCKMLARAGDYDKAFGYLKSALDKRFNNLQWLYNTNFYGIYHSGRLLRAEKEKWAELLDMYFPSM